MSEDGETRFSEPTVIAPVLGPRGLFKGYDLQKVAQLFTSIKEMDRYIDRYSVYFTHLQQ